MTLLTKFGVLLAFTTLATAQVFCAQIVLSTTAYECALVASANSCPVNTDAGFSYWPATATATDGMATNTGCCASTATPHSTGTDIACCPCEAICTGSLPALCGWSTTDGVLAIIQTTPSPTTITVPTGDVLSEYIPSSSNTDSSSVAPYHGPEMASSTVTESSVTEASRTVSVTGTPVTTKSFASPVPTFSESPSSASITTSTPSSGSAAASKSSTAAAVSTNGAGALRPMGFDISVMRLMPALG